MWTRIWKFALLHRNVQGIVWNDDLIFFLLKPTGESDLLATPFCPCPPDGLPSCRLSVSTELCGSKGPRASWVGQRECSVERERLKAGLCLRLVKLRVGYETWHLQRKQAVCKFTRPKEKRAGRTASLRAAPAHSCVTDTCWWPLFVHQSWKAAGRDLASTFSDLGTF